MGSLYKDRSGSLLQENCPRCGRYWRVYLNYDGTKTSILCPKCSGINLDWEPPKK